MSIGDCPPDSRGSVLGIGRRQFTLPGFSACIARRLPLTALATCLAGTIGILSEVASALLTLAATALGLLMAMFATLASCFRCALAVVREITRAATFRICHVCLHRLFSCLARQSLKFGLVVPHWWRIDGVIRAPGAGASETPLVVRHPARETEHRRVVVVLRTKLNA